MQQTQTPTGLQGQTASPYRSYAAIVLRSFMQNKLAVIGFILLILVILFSFVGPIIYGVSPYHTSILKALQPPSAKHWLGTDDLGRDELSRMMYGGQSSLIVVFASAVVSMIIGVIYGAVSGYIGGFLDNILMRVIDILLAIPVLLLLILLVSMFRPSESLLIIVLAATGWFGTARLIRGEALSLRNREYVDAVKALGGSDGRIVFRHILPNAIGAITVTAAFQIGGTILTLAGLSFLGLGVPPPTPNWGSMLSGAATNYIYQNYWWLIYPPGIAILVTTIAFFLIGNALRDAFDMRLRTSGN